MKIKERGLAMKLVRVEQQFDGPRLLFYFTAEERVDFRDLVRDLAGQFRCRIEMRQIGARDEAKLLGGYGTCGPPAVLHHLAQWVRTDLDQDGETPTSQPESLETLRAVWSAEVLPSVRASQRGG